MGQSIACAARIDGADDRGTALLETDEVIFRGMRSRARVPFASIGALAMKGEWLVLTHTAGVLELALGTKGAAWIPKIQKPKGIVEKLGVKAGARVAMVALTDADVEAGLTAIGATVRAGAPRGETDVILFGLKGEGDLARIPGLVARLARDGALWTVRPKGPKGVAEGAVRAAAFAAGLVDVKVARYSDTHTAEKFVIPVAKR